MRKKLQDRDKSSSCFVRRKHARKAVRVKKANYNRLGVPWPGKRQTCSLSLPEKLSIDDPANRREAIRLFDRLRSEGLEQEKNVILNFHRVDLIYPPAMLIFIAEIDRMKKILGNKFAVTIANVPNNHVKQVLVQIGFYELCNLTPPRLEIDKFADNVRHWHFAAGERVDDDTNKAFESIEGRISPEAKKGMWKALSEALINSVQHAYAQPRGTRGPRMKAKRWWMFTQEKNGELTIAVCDLGIGIPRSLPLNWNQGILTQLFSRLTGDGDVRAVKAALEVGATSTGQSHRGKGLPQIWHAVRGSPGAGIVIHSNRARLAWNSKEQKEFEREFHESINGTLVMWTVKTSTIEAKDE